MARGATARLFAAVDPPPDVAAALGLWARSAARSGAGVGHEPGLRVLDPASLHVTLIFLGQRPTEEIEPLAAALVEAAQRSQGCELETGAPVWLPPRRPRALAIEVHDPSGALAALQRDLAAGLCAITAEQPPRRFRAHVTVARSRAAPRSKGPLPATPQRRFAVTEAVLYRSLLAPEGARYEALASAPLGGWGG